MKVFPLDWVARNVYWADSGKQTIEVANMDTKGKKVLIDEQIRNPRGIAVHPSTSRLFWTDWDRNYPRIETSTLDGSNRYFNTGNQIILKNDSQLLFYIFLDESLLML